MSKGSNKAKIASPTELKWPFIESDKEKRVLELLENVFSKYKTCLRTIRKAPKWKKVKEEKEEQLSEEEEKQRKTFKSWFVVGIQTVMRLLERKKLSAVILWEDIKPAVLRKALLQLVSQQGCPAVSVTDLLPSLQKSWPSLTAAAVLGIQKTEEPNDFEELVTAIRLHAPKVTATSVVEVIKTEQAPADSDLAENEIKSQEVSKETGQNLKNEIHNGNIGHQVVDGKKFYIYKSDDNKSKSFSGQSFIAFGEDRSCRVVETVKGERVQEDSRGHEYTGSFGIRPSLAKVCTSYMTSNTSIDKTVKDNERNNRKRKNMETETMDESGYKRINLKKLQKNMQKNKKMKKKKKKTQSLIS